MVTTSGYPSCCGALVFTGFSGDDRAVMESLIQCARTANDRMKWSFVLNDRQVRALPLTLAEAHRIGFVLSASWVNYNHNSQLYEFERCGERLTLNSAAEKIAWPGRVKTPNLGGNIFNDASCLLDPITNENTLHVPAGAGGGRAVRLPDEVREDDFVRLLVDNQHSSVPLGSILRVRSGYTNTGTTKIFMAAYLRADGREDSVYIDVQGSERVEAINGAPALQRMPGTDIVVGDTVRVTSRRSQHYGRELVVNRVVPRDYDDNILQLANPGEGDVRLVVTSCTKITPAVPPAWVANYRAIPWRTPAAPVAFDPPFQEINLVGEEEQWRAVRPGDAQVREVRVEVPVAVVRASLLTRYRARYRDGRVGAAFDTLAALREANPRVGQYVREDIFNTAPHVVQQNPQDMPR